MPSHHNFELLLSSQFFSYNCLGWPLAVWLAQTAPRDKFWTLKQFKIMAGWHTVSSLYCVTYLLLPRLASGDISIIYNMKCKKYTYILYYQITGICISASDNSGKRKGTFKDFLKSVTNGKFYAAENEFEFVSDGKYSTIL